MRQEPEKIEAADGGIGNTLRYADYAGIASSALCLVHCLATPLLLAFSLAPNHHTHTWLGFAFLLVSLVMVILTTLNSHSTTLSFLLFLSFIGLGTGTFFEHTYTWAPYLMYGSTVLLIVGHTLNIWQCRRQCKTAALPLSRS